MSNIRNTKDIHVKKVKKKKKHNFFLKKKLVY